MNWYKIFWYFTIADNLKTICAWLSIVSSVFFVVFVIVRLASIDNTAAKFFELSRPARTTFFISLFLGIGNLFLWSILPSKKDALVIIVGGTVGNFVTTDSSSAKIPADLTRYLHNYMQREISNLDSETKKDLGLETPKDKFLEKVKQMSKDEVIKLIQSDSTIQIR